MESESEFLQSYDKFSFLEVDHFGLRDRLFTSCSVVVKRNQFAVRATGMREHITSFYSSKRQNLKCNQ